MYLVPDVCTQTSTTSSPTSTSGGCSRASTEPVSPDLEIAAVTDRVCKSPGGGPALLFEKPTGYDMPVATNVYGSIERMCLALGVKTLDDLAERDRRADDAADAAPASWTR